MRLPTRQDAVENLDKVYGTTVRHEVPKGTSPESIDKISQSSANPRSSDSSKFL